MSNSSIFKGLWLFTSPQHSYSFAMERYLVPDSDHPGGSCTVAGIDPASLTRPHFSGSVYPSMYLAVPLMTTLPFSPNALLTANRSPGNGPEVKICPSFTGHASHQKLKSSVYSSAPPKQG